MYLETIKSALGRIREDLVELTRTDKIIYDAQPLVDVTKRLIDIIEKKGIPDIDVQEVRGIDHFHSDYFNDFSQSMYRSMISISRLVEEIIKMSNDSLVNFNEKINQIEPEIDTLIQRVDDIERQTLEKVTNKSITEAEVKNIDFDKNVQSNSLSVINNSLFLPIKSQQQIEVNDQSFGIVGGKNSNKKLSRKITSTESKTDSETIEGTYFGNIVGMLDGSESFTSEKEITVDALYNSNINQTVHANYYTGDQRDNLTVQVENIFNRSTRFNFMTFDIDGHTSVVNYHNGIPTNVEVVNNIWPFLTSSDKVVLEIKQDTPTHLKYQGIDLISKNSGTVVKRYNYFSSLAYLYPETLKLLNDQIEVATIDPTPQQETRLVTREGWVKYPININSISLYLNEYILTGSWTSNLITVVDPIISIDFSANQKAPDQSVDYISYEVSLDNINWHPIKPSNVGVNTFNKSKKKRIVLNADNNNDDYLFLGIQPPVYGFYFRVNLKSNSAIETPVIYNIELRVKVEKE